MGTRSSLARPMAANDPRHCDGAERQRETRLSLGRHVLVTREQVIALIMHMKTLDKDYARTVMLRENENHPEWDLLQAIREVMERQ